MSLMTVLSVSIRPGLFSTYEARVQRLAEKTVAKKEPFEWAAEDTRHAWSLMETVIEGRRAAFKDIDRELTDLPRDLQKVAEIGARHRLQFASSRG